jgi:hypothetical protein
MSNTASTQWFTSRDGIVRGPFSVDEIEARIRSLSLALLDLIYAESIGHWTVLNDVSEFADVCQQTFHSRKSGKRGEWIILKASTATSQVLGPFDKDQIFAMLSAGDLKYSDSVWKPGDERWFKLGEREEFDRRRAVGSLSSSPVDFDLALLDTDVASQINELSGAKLLENIRRMHRLQIVNNEDHPEGIQGDDLTSNFANLGKTLKSLLALVVISLASVLAISSPALAKRSANSERQMATNRQEAKLALYYSSKKMRELAMSLADGPSNSAHSESAASLTGSENDAEISPAAPTMSEFREKWKTEFDEANLWIKNLSPRSRLAYPRQISRFQKSSKLLLTEFERRGNASHKQSSGRRAPASAEVGLEALTNDFTNLQQEIGRESTAKTSDVDEPVSQEQ